MKRVQVKASRNYDVLIGTGLLGRISEVISPQQKVAVVTEETVASYHLDRLNKQLKELGKEAEIFIFTPGEQSKNISVLSDILEWLAGIKMSRGDLLIAFGGGVTGDLAGFAAAVFLRGISFIQIPTTFLAAIDSSVGGKTAIDLKAGKNLAGSFYQPVQVICDTELLATLPPEIFDEGTAEAVKYGILGDRDLFDQIKAGNTKADLEEIIYRCVSMKRDVVEDDEFDIGQRQLLNLGHTFGHCVEKLSNFEISHGHAVAVGLALIARAAVTFGHLAAADRDEIIGALEANGLPVSCGYDWIEMMDVMKQDKKRRGDRITLVIPTGIGMCILHSVTVEEAGEYLRAGLQN